MFEVSDECQGGARIIVIGVGGAGGNALHDMLDVENVDFYAANTDAQALKRCHSSITTIQLGEEVTRGLGAGADPEIGRRSAEEDRARLQEILQGVDMLFITAGMGGGTGTGAAPVIAEIAKSLGILTVAVVTKPFIFEGKKRLHIAEQGIQALSQHVDSLITIPNNKLLTVLGKSVSLTDAFQAGNQVLKGAVEGIANLITCPGLINVDFADVRTVMSEMGMAMMGTGIATGAMGDGRAEQAAQAAISSPLLEDLDIAGAKGVLVNITASSSMSIGEFEVVGDVVRTFMSDEATVVVGTVIDEQADDELRVTVVATGLVVPDVLGGTEPVAKKVKKDGTIDYRSFDQPAVHRNRQVAKTPGSSSSAIPLEKENLNYLDIPSFLRRREQEGVLAESEEE
jgi:cell division protein FtsZ